MSVFKDKTNKLKPRTKIPGRHALLTLIEGIAKDLAADISTMLRDEYMSITMDGWTSYANDSYHYLTIVFNTEL